MSKSRRKAREVAFKALYLSDVAGKAPAEACQDALEGLDLDQPLIEYIHRVVEGVHAHQDEIDDIIGRHSSSFALDRLAVVDRALLRLAIYEILFEREIPPAVSINEAVELAKKFSTEQSGSFVNGVLGGFVKEANLETHGQRN